MMMTRREAVKALAGGIAFCGCPSRIAAHPGKRPVRIRGRTIKTIDVHAHCFVPDAVALLDDQRRAPLLAPGFSTTREDRLLQAESANVERRLSLMDAQAIDMEVLSITPFWYGDPRDASAAIVRLQNERLAELCASHPGRFAAFATVSLQYPDLAVTELEHAVRSLGLRGAAIGAHVNGIDFSDRRFHPVWAKAEELGAVLLIHPTEFGIADFDKRLAGNGVLANTVGNPLSTTIALQHLIFEGTLDRFPGLKLLAVHGGGYLPSYAARSDHICRVAAGSCNDSIRLEKKPSEYLKQIYYDSLVFTAEGLRHLVAEVGAGQVMLGTDAPYPWESHPVDHVMNTPGLSDSERMAILGGNAARLLGL